MGSGGRRPPAPSRALPRAGARGGALAAALLAALAALPRGGARGAGLLALLAALALALLAALLALAAPARAPAETSQSGELVASLDGGISPLRLPRDHPAPAALTIAGGLRTADGSPLPRIRSVEVALAGRGSLDTAGLPTCPRPRLQATDPPAALAACAAALVGRGRLDVSVALPTQAPFVYHAGLLAFNAVVAGRRAILLHVYGDDPPLSFVLPVTLRRGDADFPTAMRIAVPASAGPWPHLARFHLTLSRRFAHRGRPHSYLNASCPLPPSFTAGIFPFARATYAWGANQTLTTTIVRSCRARN